MDNLRGLQLKELEILCDVRDVCNRNDITYYLAGGTLLGAVRHKGFIPWDDDVDIMMPYEDYKRFVDVAQRELGDKYFVQNNNTDKFFYPAFTKVCLNNTTYVPKYNLNYKVHHGIWLDVFPLINISDENDLRKKKLEVKIANSLLIKEYYISSKDEFNKLLTKKQILLLRLLFIFPYHFRKRIHDKIIKKICEDGDGEYKALLWTSVLGIFNRAIFQGTCELNFENELFSVPIDYDLFLTTQYGDYMVPPPVNNRPQHGWNFIIDFENGYEKYINQ